MAKRAVVPQFGNWDGENNLPYTIYFDEARKAKNGGKLVNPNDPMDYPGMFPYSPKATPTNAPKEPIGQRAVTPITLHSHSRENGDNNKFSDAQQINANKRPVVPQFGNWDGDNVPYTIYFDEARKSKLGGNMINPNDPMEYPGMFPSSPQATPSRAKNVPEEPIGRTSVRPTTFDSQSGENKDRKRFTDTPVSNDNSRGIGSTHHNRRGNGPGSDQPGRQNGGSLHSIDRSPLHPQFQAKRNEKSSGSPARESKRPSGNSNATPGRSRMKPVSTGVQYPEKGAAVPRFGEWDEANPSSGDNYTHAFNQVRHEKISGSPMVSNMGAEQGYATRQKQNGHDKYKSLSRWFPCFGK